MSYHSNHTPELFEDSEEVLEALWEEALERDRYEEEYFAWYCENVLDTDPEPVVCSG